MTIKYTNIFPQDAGLEFEPVENRYGLVMQSSCNKRNYLYANIDEVFRSGKWEIKK